MRAHPFACLAILGTLGCYTFQTSDGGGQTDFEPPRQVDPSDVALPDGYRIEVVARDLTFPTKVIVDPNGRVYVVEGGYSYGERFTRARLLRLERDGERAVIAEGDEGVFWSGADLHEGVFYVSEARATQDSRILKISMSGEVNVLVDGLPPIGIHHTNSPVVREDWLYFPQGTMTNAAVPGVRDYYGGWLKRHPDLHDIPGQDITLAGVNYEVPNPFTQDDEDDTVTTGVYVPFGTATRAGQVVRGGVPATGAVMRLPVGGGPLEVVAWGFRNPFRIAFGPDGRLFATDNGFDATGPRAVFASADFLWEVKPGLWHGWPDFVGGEPITWERYQMPLEPGHRFVLAKHPNPPPEPIARLACHASVAGIAISTSARFGHVGQAFVAEFGDMATATGKVLAPVGFKVVRVDLESGAIRDFAVNRGDRNGPASKLRTNGMERPIDVTFDQEGTSMYVLDFGVLLIEDTDAPTAGSSFPQTGTGVLWRITRERAEGVAMNGGDRD